MDITELPFNKLIDLHKSYEDKYILVLNDNSRYSNHLGTVHASALFSLAEATSGYLLLKKFPMYVETLVPVVRKVDVKYKRSAIGRIQSMGSIINDSIENILQQIMTKNRATVTIKIDLYDSKEINVLSANFEWFISMLNK